MRDEPGERLPRRRSGGPTDPDDRVDAVEGNMSVGVEKRFADQP